MPIFLCNNYGTSLPLPTVGYVAVRVSESVKENKNNKTAVANRFLI